MNPPSPTSAPDPGMNTDIPSPVTTPHASCRMGEVEFSCSAAAPGASKFAGFSLGQVLLGLLGLCLLRFVCSPVQAQWITQTNTLQPGWNAVYLHVDPDHATLSDLAGLSGPIEEIWHWNPPLPLAQIHSPKDGEQRSQWTKWKRSDGSTGQKLNGNGAYLVRVNNTAGTYLWPVKGKPVTPTYRWTLTGLNLVGFPTLPNSPTNFADFFQPAPELLTGEGGLFRYQGGELGATNPVAVSPFLAPITPVIRSQAYWARAGETYIQYFGPFQILGSDQAGLRFGAQGGQARFRLRNLVTNTITVTLTQVPSETNPRNGTTPLIPPLLLRGNVNPVDLQFTYSDLTAAPQHWTLTGKGEVGSEVEVILGLNRAAMTGDQGTVYASILRLTDSLGFSQVDLSVSAVKESTAGLWVGGAEVTNVNHYLTTYAQATSPVAFTNLLIGKGLAVLSAGVMQPLDGYRYQWDSASSRVLVFGGPNTNRGNYLVESSQNVGAGVANSFPLRLIRNRPGNLLITHISNGQ